MTTTRSIPTTIRSLGTSVGLAGLVAALTPVWFVHDRATRRLGARRHGTRVDVPRIPASLDDLRTVMDDRRPVIVEGLLGQLGLDDAATPTSLASRAGDLEVEVAVHDRSRPYFLYTGGYGAQVVERRTMTLAALLDLLFVNGVDDGTVVYQLLGIRALGGAVAPVLREFATALEPHTPWATEPRFSGVWMGSTGAVTPLHHDAWPGLLFQTHGSKRIALYAPRDRTNLYFRSPLHGAGRWSTLPGRSAEADVEEYPRLVHAERFVGELTPGDALYIPPFWAHEMEALEPNISVPFRFSGPRRTYLNPGFLRPAAEMLRAHAPLAR